MKRIQINGGSLFLDSDQRIHLPLADSLKDVHIEHFSVPCKSNQSIVMDVYQNIDKFDIFVLNFTFADRFPLWLDNHLIEMSASRNIPGILPLPKFEDNADFLEDTISKFTKMYYQYFCNLEYNNSCSNMLVDLCVSLLKQHDKKFILSNCEPLHLKETDKQCWYNDPKLSVYKSKSWDQFLDKQGHLPEKYLHHLSQDIFNFGVTNSIW